MFERHIKERPLIIGERSIHACGNTRACRVECLGIQAIGLCGTAKKISWKLVRDQDVGQSITWLLQP